MIGFNTLNIPAMGQTKKLKNTGNKDSMSAFSDHCFRSMIDQSPSATSIYSLKGDLLYYNRAFYQLWKLSENQKQDLYKDYNILSDANFSESIEEIRKVIRDGVSWKASPKKIKIQKQKEEVYVSSTFFPLKKDDGEVSEIVLVQEDITTLLQTNAELRKNIKEIGILKDALDVSSIITEVDNEGNLIRVNDKFYELSKYSKTDFISLSIFDLRTGNMPSAFYEGLWKTIRKGKIWKGEMENRTKTGEIYWTDTTIVPLIKSSDSPTSYLGLSSNITERKIAEKEIIKLNSNLEKEVKKRTEDIEAAVGELEAFSYSVSHDLRAPLRAITGFSGLLKEEFGDNLNEEAKRYLGIIQKGTKQMAQLIDDLLHFSRVGRIELQKKTFDPNPIVQEILKKEREGLGENVNFKVQPLPPIYGDSNTISLVFTNLIINAIKFAKDVSTPSISIGSKEVDDEVIYYIKDNGVGFDMRYADKLFKVFQRLHSAQQFEGTGVGLAIVSRIVYKHGGRVWGESYPGTETSFYFTIPKKVENDRE